MFYVIVSDPISDYGLEPLYDCQDITIIKKNISEVMHLTDTIDAILVRSSTNVTKELINKMPRLKLIARAGVGVDNIDVEAATKKGIIVINAPDGNTISTTEHTFAMIAALLRNIPQANNSVKSNEWNRSAFVGTELAHKRLGIIGFGRIGTELAKRARAFDMSVIVYDPFLTKAKAQQLQITQSSLEELLETSDIITVHTPLTPQTKGLINGDNLAKTKQGVFLINCDRGGIIDEKALLHYIEKGHVRGAALDVFEQEPPFENKLLEMDQVIVTPHLGASTKEAQENVARQVAKEIVRYISDLPVTTSVNLPTLSTEVVQKIRPFFQLARSMGKFLTCAINSPIEEVNLQYAGWVTELDTTYISRNFLAGLLSGKVDYTVNEINAAVIAKDRGITFGESYSQSSKGYSNCIDVLVTTEREKYTIRGTYVPDYGPRIVGLDDFSIDIQPSGFLLYIQHKDQPGVIGKVGKILGEHQINIATMQVGRKQLGGDAIMILTFDDSIPDVIIKEMKLLHEIKDTLFINLNEI